MYRVYPLKKITIDPFNGREQQFYVVAVFYKVLRRFRWTNDNEILRQQTRINQKAVGELKFEIDGVTECRNEFAGLYIPFNNLRPFRFDSRSTFL